MSSRPAANSSSTKNGLPPERAWTSSTVRTGTAACAIASSWQRHVLAVERGELDARDERPPPELGHQPAQRVAALELAGAVGQHQREPLVAQVAGQELDQVTRRAIGPVDVLEHDRQRRALA